MPKALCEENKKIYMRINIDGLIENLKKNFKCKNIGQQFTMNCVFEELTLFKKENDKLKEEKDKLTKEYEDYRTSVKAQYRNTKEDNII